MSRVPWFCARAGRRSGLLMVLCAGCWFDLGDVESSATQTSSSAGGAPATTSTGAGGAGGRVGIGGAPLGGDGPGGFGGDGGRVPAGGEGGSGPQPPPFQSCEALGYLGMCAGASAELLFYWNEDYDNGIAVCENQAASEVCLINDCTLNGTECAVNPTCSDAQCGAKPATFINCPDSYDTDGACLHGVAIRQVSTTNCEFRDCSLIPGWECRDSTNGVPEADCFLGP